MQAVCRQQSRVASAPFPRAVRLDFSCLDAQARLRERRAREAWERERLANIEEMKGDLARLAPNLKAR
jgi:hypothetical protein